MHPFRSPVAPLLVAAVALIACGDNDATRQAGPATGQAAEAEPWDESSMEGCALVSDEEFRAAVGEPIENKEEGGYFGCRWTTASHRIALNVFATATLPADMCTDDQSSMAFGQTARGKLYPVEGLGERAQWGSSGQLHVCGPRGLLVVLYEHSPSTMAHDEERSIAEVLAGHALARLDQT